MDIIVQRNFDQEEVQNYAGAESSEDVAAGIISFDDSHFGRQISELCLRYVSRLSISTSVCSSGSRSPVI